MAARTQLDALAISSYQQFERLRTGLLTWGEANRNAMTSATTEQTRIGVCAVGTTTNPTRHSKWTDFVFYSKDQ